MVSVNEICMSVDRSQIIGQMKRKRERKFCGTTQIQQGDHLFQPIWVQGDTLDLPFYDGWFDAIIMGYGLQNVVDKHKDMQEILRVPKPGSCYI